MVGDFIYPPGFPESEFEWLGVRTDALFPDPDVCDGDPKTFLGSLECQAAWRSVRNRYRTCSERNGEFAGLLETADQGLFTLYDHEFLYQIETCLYSFFTNALSIFESLGFCLYFAGSRMSAQYFPLIETPRAISLKGGGMGQKMSVGQAFAAAFPNFHLGNALQSLVLNPEFLAIEETRNVLSHRASIQFALNGTTEDEFDEKAFEGSTIWVVSKKTRKVIDRSITASHMGWIEKELAALVRAALDLIEGLCP